MFGAAGKGLAGMAAAGAAGGKYVPPSARGAAGAGMGSSLASMEVVDDRDNKTLRVSNISEATKEADLQVRRHSKVLASPSAAHSLGSGQPGAF